MNVLNIEAYVNLLKVLNLLGLHKNWMNTLDEFLRNPEEVTNKIIDLNNEHKDKFIDFRKGLIGELTKGTAVELGKNYIVGEISKISKEIIDTIKNSILPDGLPIKTLKDNIKAFDVTTEIEMLSSRKEAINTNELTKQHLINKTKSVIGQISITDKYNLTELEMLKTLFVILTDISERKDISLQEKIGLFKRFDSFLKNEFTHVDSDDYSSSNVDKLAEEIIAELSESKYQSIVAKLGKIVTVEDGETEVTILNDIVDLIPGVLETIKTRITTYENDINTLPEFISNLEKYINSFDENVVGKYKSGLLTKEEFYKLSANYGDAVENNINNALNLVYNVYNIGNTLNDDLGVFFVVFNHIDKLTLEGTLKSAM
jgi:hypothetical protein